MAQRLFEQAEQNRQTMTPAEWLEGLLDDKLVAPGRLFGRFGQVRDLWTDKERAELRAKYHELPEETRDEVVRSAFGDNSYLINSRVAGTDFMSAVMTDALSGAIDDLDPQKVSIEVSEYAVKWMQREPEAAAAWVDTLPDGEATAWVRKNLARSWADYDPSAVERWLGGLPASERQEVREFLGKP